MHARHMLKLYRKAEDIGAPVVVLIPTRDSLPPVDPVEVARSMAPGARYTIEALAVGLNDVYANPDDVALIDRVIKDLETAKAVHRQED